MLLILNQDQATKGKFKNCKKIIISESLPELDSESVKVTTLLPSYKIFSEYVNGDLDKEMYQKKYISYIRNNPQVFGTLVPMVMAYREHGVLCLVCSDEEMTYNYMDALAEYISDRYEIPVCSYKKFKKKYENVKDCKREMTKNGLKKLMKDFNEVRGLLLEAEDSSKKKKKKKSKKKDKKKKKKKYDSDLEFYKSKITEDQPQPLRKIVIKHLD